MQTDPFGSFIDLINFDKNLIKTESDIQKNKEEIKNHSNQIETLMYDIEQSKKFWQETRKTVDTQELKMKELDQQEKDKKEKLEYAQNPKEYNSLKKEIEQIKKMQYELEPRLLEFWKSSETAKKEYEQKKEKSDEQISLLENHITEKNSAIKFLEVQLDELKKERDQKQKDIPEEWLEKYNMMRTRVSNPVVPAENESCSACFYQITSQDLINLKHKKLLQCRSCYRFLYMK